MTCTTISISFSGESNDTNRVSTSSSFSQRLVREIESKRKEKRQSLYEAQDAVDQKKEDLINRVETMLNQKTEQNQLFTFKWTLV